jgi:hypothetical protein
MKLNTKALAQKVADLVRDRLEEQLMDAVQEAVVEVLEDNGIQLDDDDDYEVMMEVAERIALVAL